MSEHDDKQPNSRRDFLRKLGMGAAAVAVPAVAAGCNPYYFTR